ncbi:hypothetical protein GCM10023176_56880 [Micromonospora coerulea]|uniref:Uncharacterized protein n=1 Tax=Micromonospora coerulea TaxID=47856 RepID=A0ABP8T3B8_9ACTN
MPLRAITAPDCVALLSLLNALSLVPLLIPLSLVPLLSLLIPLSLVPLLSLLIPLSLVPLLSLLIPLSLVPLLVLLARVLAPLPLLALALPPLVLLTMLALLLAFLALAHAPAPGLAGPTSIGPGRRRLPESARGTRTVAKLLRYNVTKAGIADIAGSLAQLLTIWAFALTALSHPGGSGPH